MGNRVWGNKYLKFIVKEGLLHTQQPLFFPYPLNASVSGGTICFFRDSTLGRW